MIVDAREVARRHEAGAQRAGDDVSPRIDACLLNGQHSRIDILLHLGVIHGDLLENPVTHAVGPRVADVEHQPVWLVVVGDEDGAGGRCPGPPVARRVDLADLVLGRDEELLHLVAGTSLIAADPDAGQDPQRYLAGDLTALVPAHAVGEEEQSGSD